MHAFLLIILQNQQEMVSFGIAPEIVYMIDDNHNVKSVKIEI